MYMYNGGPQHGQITMSNVEEEEEEEEGEEEEDVFGSLQEKETYRME